MPRVRHGVAGHKRRKRLIKKAKGYFLGRSKLYVVARETVKRAMAFASRDRKLRKREFRRLWTVRINAACRAHGFTYSRFIKGLKEAKVGLDRKQLAHLAVHDAPVFQELVQLAKACPGGSSSQAREKSSK